MDGDIFYNYLTVAVFLQSIYDWYPMFNYINIWLENKDYF